MSEESRLEPEDCEGRMEFADWMILIIMVGVVVAGVGGINGFFLSESQADLIIDALIFCGDIGVALLGAFGVMLDMVGAAGDDRD